MLSLSIRAARQNDLDTLWTFLAIAAYEPHIAKAKATPLVAAHLAGWRRSCDFGYIAENSGLAVGATWARQFALDEEPTFYVDDDTPEISIGVSETMRRKGVGETLLDALIGEAKRRGVGLCLNVRDSNPAVRLYEQVGFRRVHGTEVRNQVGGWSFGMVLAPRLS
jgi:ribosomal protein S18 acetylase RimI-like enzyme